MHLKEVAAQFLPDSEGYLRAFHDTSFERESLAHAESYKKYATILFEKGLNDPATVAAKAEMEELESRLNVLSTERLPSEWGVFKRAKDPLQTSNFMNIKNLDVDAISKIKVESISAADLNLAKSRLANAKDWGKENIDGNAAFARLRGNTGPIDSSFDRIFKLFRSSKTFDYLSDLDLEVLAVAKKYGISPHDANEVVLQAWEKKYGLETMNLDRKMGDEEFFDLFRNHHVFRDLFFAPRSSHGINTHRIQWNLIMRDIAEKPGELFN
jgi:hypothetical protein